MGAFIALLVLAGLIWLWLDSVQAKEKAVMAAAQACQKVGVQFLDQTVSLEKLKLARNAQGRMVFQRIYGFDFSMAGVERRHGRAFMLGQKLKQMQLDVDDGTVIESVDK